VDALENPSADSQQNKKNISVANAFISPFNTQTMHS
jgi:hypothetical protein